MGILYLTAESLSALRGISLSMPGDTGIDKTPPLQATGGPIAYADSVPLIGYARRAEALWFVGISRQTKQLRSPRPLRLRGESFLSVKSREINFGVEGIIDSRRITMAFDYLRKCYGIEYRSNRQVHRGVASIRPQKAANRATIRVSPHYSRAEVAADARSSA